MLVDTRVHFQEVESGADSWALLPLALPEVCLSVSPAWWMALPRVSWDEGGSYRAFCDQFQKSHTITSTTHLPLLVTRDPGTAGYLSRRLAPRSTCSASDTTSVHLISWDFRGKSNSTRCYLVLWETWTGSFPDLSKATRLVRGRAETVAYTANFRAICPSQRELSSSPALPWL